jgi:hypothetical protein
MLYTDINDIYAENQRKDIYTAYTKCRVSYVTAGGTHGYHWALNGKVLIIHTSGTKPENTSLIYIYIHTHTHMPELPNPSSI